MDVLVEGLGIPESLRWHTNAALLARVTMAGRGAGSAGLPPQAASSSRETRAVAAGTRKADMSTA